MYMYVDIYINRERERESNHGEKKYIFEKYFGLTSLSIHCIYISLLLKALHKIFFTTFKHINQIKENKTGHYSNVCMWQL